MELAPESFPLVSFVFSGVETWGLLLPCLLVWCTTLYWSCTPSGELINSGFQTTLNGHFILTDVDLLSGLVLLQPYS
jgi:hypothetical protein